MALRVSPTTKFSIGKFGQSFVNIHRGKNDESPGSEVFLRESTNFIGKGSFGSEGLYPCLPSFRQDPQNRPYYSIENGTDIPTQDCVGEAGFRKFRDAFLNPINEEDDPFLSTDPDSDYASGTNILETKHAGEQYQTDNDHSDWKIASGIEFSMAPDIHEDYYPRQGSSIKVYWSYHKTGEKPKIVTDNRNNEYLNIANSIGINPVYWAGSRIYLEIRHGLDTMDYSYIVENMEGWIRTKKKNSLILSRFVSSYNSKVFSNIESYYRDPDSGPGIPRGRCTIMFFSDY